MKITMRFNRSSRYQWVRMIRKAVGYCAVNGLPKPRINVVRLTGTERRGTIEY